VQQCRHVPDTVACLMSASGSKGDITRMVATTCLLDIMPIERRIIGAITQTVALSEFD
jgi:hypothetical protein